MRASSVADAFINMFKKDTTLKIMVFLLIFLFIIRNVIQPVQQAMGDLILVFNILLFFLVLNWLRDFVGSPRIALLLSLIVFYLIFLRHPSLVESIITVLIFMYVIKPIIDKYKEKKKKESPEEKYLKILEEAAKQGKVEIKVEPSYPAWWYPPYHEIKKKGD